MHLDTSILAAALVIAPVAGTAAVYDVRAGDVRGLAFAIRAADFTPGDDLILLAGGTYELALPAEFDAAHGPLGLPPITGVQPGIITIDGRRATVQRSRAAGTPAFRIFKVGSAGRVVLRNLRLVNGDAGTSIGGAILNEGDLEVHDTTVEENAANHGGGIANDGVAMLERVSFVVNDAATHGGGIFNWGKLTFRSGSVGGNTAGDRGGGVYLATPAASRSRRPVTTLAAVQITNNRARAGGGVWSGNNTEIVDSRVIGNAGDSGGGILFEEGSLFLERSTVASNRATAGYGGGLHSDARVCVRASTFTDNTARDGGGAIYQYDAPPGGGDSALRLVNSTISGNRSESTDGGGVLIRNSAIIAVHTTITLNSAGGGFAGVGGVLVYDSRHFRMANVILSGNVGANLYPRRGLGIFEGMLDGDARLGPLGNNGGPTFTHLPAADSPAVGSGRLDLVIDVCEGDFPVGPPLRVDQRGARRVVDLVDLGSVER